MLFRILARFHIELLAPEYTDFSFLGVTIRRLQGPVRFDSIFHPGTGGVIAPVRLEGKWTLAEDGEVLWDRRFLQVWQQMVSPDGGKVAAVVAPAFGRWTLAVDGVTWVVTFADMVTDAVFSPDGSRIAALGKEGAEWVVVVDGKPWQERCDMAWGPVFSPDGGHVAARVEKGGKYTYLLDDRAAPWVCERYGSRRSA